MYVERLARKHVRTGFACGKPDLDEYLATTAGQDERRNVAAVFVLVDDGSADVIGYYTLSAYSVLLNDLPDDLRTRLPLYPVVPATLLGRLAVTTKRHGERLGTFLLVDALARSATATGDVASAAVIVDAIDKEARAFYKRFGFAQFADNPLKLYLPMTTVRKLVIRT